MEWLGVPTLLCPYFFIKEGGTVVPGQAHQLWASAAYAERAVCYRVREGGLQSVGVERIVPKPC